MAGHAVLRKPKERARQILHPDQLAFRRDHMRWCVTLLADHSCMFSLQRVAGKLVVEFFEWFFPVNQIEIFAVMLEMAVNAIPPVGIWQLESRVVSVLGIEALRNLLVAIEAFECRRARAELMAAGALRCAGQRLVRLGKRPRRNLS